MHVTYVEVGRCGWPPVFQTTQWRTMHSCTHTNEHGHVQNSVKPVVVQLESGDGDQEVYLQFQFKAKKRPKTTPMETQTIPKNTRTSGTNTETAIQVELDRSHAAPATPALAGHMCTQSRCTAKPPQGLDLQAQVSSEDSCQSHEYLAHLDMSKVVASSRAKRMLLKALSNSMANEP